MHYDQLSSLFIEGFWTAAIENVPRSSWRDIFRAIMRDQVAAQAWPRKLPNKTSVTSILVIWHVPTATTSFEIALSFYLVFSVINIDSELLL